jgi:Fur family transcriptional regulator, peroxide stress response regulator
MQSFSEVVIRRLTLIGRQPTPAELAVIDALAMLEAPASGREIADQLNGAGKPISQVRVHRLLETLERLDLVHRVPWTNLYARCLVVSAEGHVHLHCRRCQHLIDVESETMSAVERDTALQTGFRIESRRVVLFGLCPACRELTASRATGP